MVRSTYIIRVFCAINIQMANTLRGVTPGVCVCVPVCVVGGGGGGGAHPPNVVILHFCWAILTTRSSVKNM